MYLNKSLLSRALLASTLSASLIGCGSAANLSLATSSASSPQSYNYVSPTPTPTPTATSTSANTGTPPYQYGFRIHGTAGGAVAPTATFSDGTFKTVSVQADTKLRVELRAQSYGNIYDDLNNSITTNGFAAQCFQFNVAVGNQSPITLSVNTTSSDGTGNCPGGTMANPSVDLSSQLSHGHGSVTITLSNVESSTCGALSRYYWQQCYLNTLLKSYIAIGTLIVHTDSTN